MNYCKIIAGFSSSENITFADLGDMTPPSYVSTIYICISESLNDMIIIVYNILYLDCHQIIIKIIVYLVWLIV